MHLKLALGVVSAVGLASWLWFANEARPARQIESPAAALAMPREELSESTPNDALVASAVERSALPPALSTGAPTGGAGPATPRSLRVEVLDARGEPLPAAVVRLMLAMQHEAGEGRSGYGTYRAAHDALHPHIAIPAEDLAEVFAAQLSAGSASRVLLEVEVVGLTAPSKVLASAEIPSEPIQLRVGPAGCAIVEICDADGHAFLGEAHVILRAAPREMPLEDEKLWTRIPGAVLSVSGGRAVFPCVGLGQRLRAEVRDRDERFVASREITLGPLIAGDEVTLRVALRDALPVLYGRFLDASGAPLARRSVSWFAEVRFGRHGSTLTTDAEGRFELPWNEDLRRQAPYDALVFYLGEALDPGSATQLRPPPAIPLTGRVDLGTLTLREPERAQLLAAGTVVDTDGTPLAEAEITALAIWPLVLKGPHEEHRELRCEFVRTGADGSFRLVGTDPCRGLKVDARLADHYQESVLLAERGRDDLRLVLRRGGTLRGNVLLDPAVPPSIFEVAFVAENGRVLASSKLQPDGLFALRGLRPTRGRVEVRSQGFELARITDVEPTPSDVPSDPRLVDLDLRTRMRQLLLRAVDFHGRAIPSARVLYVGGAQGLATVGLDPVGRASPFVPRELESIEVGLEGFAPRTIAWSAEEQLVRFEAPLSVRFRLDPALVFPESHVLEVATRVPERTAISPLERRLVDMQPESLAQGAELLRTLPRAGRYELHLWVSEPVARRREYVGERAFEVGEEPGVTEVTVGVDAAKLRAALEKLR
jgi:hypothetical protein